jgi:hypothetical protein
MNVCSLFNDDFLITEDYIQLRKKGWQVNDDLERIRKGAEIT